MKKIILSVLFFTACFFTANAQYTMLSDFTGNDAFSGTNPRYDQNLISDGTFLYGMTSGGGTNDMGAIFKILPDGTGYSKLLDFTGTANGENPYGSLIYDGTFLYGMTSEGGTNFVGTIFKIKPDGTGYSKLLDFLGTANGSHPYGSLVSDGTFLYGMTSSGGTNDMGVIFKIMPDGTGYSKLLNFTGVTNGHTPYGSLISDGAFLYGMTNQGGTNDRGVIFKILPDGTGYSRLLDFEGETYGENPKGSLISDGTFLYGMTNQGGIYYNGIIFKILPDGTGYSKLLDFAGVDNGSDPYGSLISDGTFLYGMTSDDGTYGRLGSIFKIMPDGSGYSKLLDFAGAANGRQPYGSLISDGTFLYGMTYRGGTNDKGVIFNITSDGTGFSKLLDFAGAINGDEPYGSLISDGTFLYGMTSLGGTNNMGVIFKIMPDGSGYVKILNFDYTNGGHPYGSLISDGTFLYGMTYDGGAYNYGTVFKIKPDGNGYVKILDFDYAIGGHPYGSLVSDGTFLYGMAYSGGTNGMGFIFKIKPDGTGFVKLLDFTLTGNTPRGSLIYDGIFLYGMTYSGGANNYGTVFKIKPDGSGYINLVDFAGFFEADGSFPYGSLIYDGTFLYGMTESGGTNNLGTVFKVKPDGSGYLKILDFEEYTNGKYPLGSLIYDGTFLYGMANSGGTNNNGTVFKIKPDGSGYLKILDFENSNGNYPNGSLFSDGTYLYGMTMLGGTCDAGTIFKYQYCAAGIDVNNTGADFNVYPNPNSGKFQISNSGNISSIEIYNLMGENVFQSTIKNQRSEIDISNQTKGIYFIKIYDGKTVLSKKIVLQ